MIQASSAYTSAVNSDGRTVRVQLLIDGQLIGGNITSVTISRGACGAQPLTGSIFVPSIEATVKGLTTTGLEGKTITAKIGLVTSREPETIEYVNAGSYVVSKPQTSAGITSISGLGTLSTIGMETATITHSDVAGVIADVEAGTGVTVRLQGVTASGSFDYTPEGTWRSVMQEVALALNGFLTEDVDGNWTIAKFCSGSVVSISANRSQEAPRYDEQPYTLESMNVESGEVDMTMGNPLLDPWDVLSVTDIDGVTHLVPCLRITHTLNGGLSTSVHAEVETAIQEEAKVAGSVEGLVQHFWFDGNGAHVTEVTKEEFLQNPSAGGSNLLARSNGLAIRDGLLEIAQFEGSGITFNMEGYPEILKLHAYTDDYGNSTGSLALGDTGNPSINGYQDMGGDGAVYMSASDSLPPGANPDEDPGAGHAWVSSTENDSDGARFVYTEKVSNHGSYQRTYLGLDNAMLLFGSSGPEATEGQAFTVDRNGNGTFAGKVTVGNHIIGNGGATITNIYGNAIYSKRGTAASISGHYRLDALYAIECRPGANKTLTTSQAHIPTPVAYLDCAGDWLTLNSNGTITVRGACYVSAWVYLYITGVTAGDAIYLYIEKNGTAQATYYQRHPFTNQTVSLPAKIIRCAAGDVLRITCRNSTAGRGIVNASSFSCFGVRVESPL